MGKGIKRDFRTLKISHITSLYIKTEKGGKTLHPISPKS
jgi:hypothetical protein